MLSYSLPHTGSRVYGKSTQHPEDLISCLALSPGQQIGQLQTRFHITLSAELAGDRFDCLKSSGLLNE